MRDSLDSPQGAPVAPIEPLPVDFGLDEADLKRLTLRDMLLSEGLASVSIVLVTVLAIWRFWLWGIALACAALGVIYLLRRAIDVLVIGRIDKARVEYDAAMQAHTRARHAYDEAMDVWEVKSRGEE
ncbi:MAG: hypothetical protein O2985_06215 [Proteobacteria bacterium]|nr:hypothetical protein [Pseudomonadota bacterium]